MLKNRTSRFLPLPANDSDIVAALDAYNAKYSKGPSKRLKDQRAETLAGLSWLHLNHADVSRALSRLSEPQQLLPATALSLDYETLPSKIALAGTRTRYRHPRDARRHAHQS